MLAARVPVVEQLDPDAVDTVSAALRTWAVRRSDETFCTFVSSGSQERISFEQLYERSRSYTAYYRQRGVRPGDLVIIILKHSAHLFYSYLGAMLLGAVPTFLAFPTPKQRPEVYWAEHKILFDRIEPRLIVTYAENVGHAAKLLQMDRTAFGVAADEVLTLRLDDGSPIPRACPDDLACLQHSSGTTGTKKGVMLTHRAIIDAVRSYSEALGFGPSDRIASWLPLYHDMGFIAAFMSSVVNGSHLVALDAFEWVSRPTLLLDTIEQHDASFCWLPNFAFSHIVNTERAGAKRDLSGVRAFINCSEPCRSETMERFVERFSASGVAREMLHACYALAENVFAVTQTRLGQPARTLFVEPQAFRDGVIVPTAGLGEGVALLSSGVPLSGTAIEIRAPDGGPAAAAAVGQIFIRSSCLFSGYYRLPESSRRALADGWYATGDLGFLHDGELFVTGRIDDMIILNGRNFYAHEIEALVADVPGVIPGRVCALAVFDAAEDYRTLVLLVECQSDVSGATLKRVLRRRIFDSLSLAVAEIDILAPGELFKTTSGKMSRERNLEHYLRRSAASRRQAES